MEMPEDRDAAKTALVERLAAARNGFLAVLRDLPEDLRVQPLALPAGSSGDGAPDLAWSPKDTAGHVASWENRYITLAQQLINGHADQIQWIASEEDLHTWNHKEYQRKRDWSWTEVLRDLALMREELLWNLGWASPEQVFATTSVPRGTASVAGLLEGLIEHDEEHTAQLRRWLEGAARTAP
jgi:hypothetical protein